MSAINTKQNAFMKIKNYHRSVEYKSFVCCMITGHYKIPLYNSCHVGYFCVLHSFPIHTMLTCKHIFNQMKTSVDPDQMASSEAS